MNDQVNDSLLKPNGCNLKVGKRSSLSNLSSTLLERNGTTNHKQNFWQCFSNLLFANVFSWIFHKM